VLNPWANLAENYRVSLLKSALIRVNQWQIIGFAADFALPESQQLKGQ